MASGVPYATWDGKEYLVRVDLDPEDAREIAYALGSRDGAFQLFHAAADRVDVLRAGEDPDAPTACPACHGTGTTQDHSHGPMACDRCNGSGVVDGRG